MQIHPELRALRGDDSPQRQAQQALHDAMVAWHAQPSVGEVIAGVRVFAAGRDMADCPALLRLFEDGDDSAERLADSFVRAGAGGLEGHPLAHLPQRHSHDSAISTLVLARSGNVTLSLVAIDGEGVRARPEVRSASFWPGETWEHFLAGSAKAELLDLRDADGDSARLVRCDMVLGQGKVVCRDSARQALVLRRVDNCLVSLRLQRRREQAGATREYDIASGAMVHQAAGNPRDSRIELMLAMLGRMGRADAAPVMAEIAREPGSDALRWQALRECLGLDTATGFAALTAIARDATDPLAAPAGALRSQLVETWPQLKELA